MRAIFTGRALERIKRLYAEGIGTDSIAALEGCSQNTVWRTLKRNGVEMRSEARRPRLDVCFCGESAAKPGGLCAQHKRERFARILELRRAGYTIRKVSQDHDTGVAVYELGGIE